MKELNEMELREVDGGLFWLIPILAGVMLTSIVNDWSGFKQGIVDAFSEWKYKNNLIYKIMENLVLLKNEELINISGGGISTKTSFGYDIGHVLGHILMFELSIFTYVLLPWCINLVSGTICK